MLDNLVRGIDGWQDKTPVQILDLLSAKTELFVDDRRWTLLQIADVVGKENMDSMIAILKQNGLEWAVIQAGGSGMPLGHPEVNQTLRELGDGRFETLANEVDARCGCLECFRRCCKWFESRRFRSSLGDATLCYRVNAVMTISRISSATNNGTTITLGTHAKGDLLMIFGYRDASATAPTLPSGWYNLMATPTSSPALVIGWKIAASSSESSGTWTNANTLHSIVYRAGTGNIVIPTIISTSIGTSTTPSFGNPAITGTFPTNIDDYWIVGMMGMRNSNNNLQSATWTGLSNVTSATDGSSWQVVVNDSNATRTTAWTSQSATVTTSATWRSAVVGLIEFPTQAASGGGGFRTVNIRGGADQ